VTSALSSRGVVSRIWSLLVDLIDLADLVDLDRKILKLNVWIADEVVVKVLKCTF
jgi:hypothetical protein